MAKTPKAKAWEYGRSPAPTNWYEAADALKSVTKPKRKSSGLLERLAAIEDRLKAKS